MSKERKRTNFKSLGADIKEARTAKKMSRKKLAEMVDIDSRYLANIENSGYIPSLPLFHDLVTVCNLPVDRYFYPDKGKWESKKYERLKLKLAFCPEKYLPMIEAVISETIKLDEAEAK